MDNIGEVAGIERDVQLVALEADIQFLMHVAALGVGRHFHAALGNQMQINQVVFAFPGHQAAPLDGVREQGPHDQHFRRPGGGQNLLIVDELARQQGGVHLYAAESIHNVRGIERDLGGVLAVRQHFAYFAQDLARRDRVQMILFQARGQGVFRLDALQSQPEPVQAHHQRFLFVNFHQDAR